MLKYVFSWRIKGYPVVRNNCSCMVVAGYSSGTLSSLFLLCWWGKIIVGLPNGENKGAVWFNGEESLRIESLKVKILVYRDN